MPLAWGAIGPKDLELLMVTDDPAEVVRAISRDAAANASSGIGPAD